MPASDESVSPALGKAIAARRITLGMKRKDLAERASLSYPYIAEIENGGKMPSQKALAQLAEALSWPTSELLRASEMIPDDADAARDLQTDSPGYDLLFAPSANNLIAAESKAYRRANASSEAMVDEVRDELRLTVRKVERLEAEVRALRDELRHLRGPNQ